MPIGWSAVHLQMAGSTSASRFAAGTFAFLTFIGHARDTASICNALRIVLWRSLPESKPLDPCDKTDIGHNRLTATSSARRPPTDLQGRSRAMLIEYDKVRLIPAQDAYASAMT